MKLLSKSARDPFLLFILALTIGTLWLIGPMVRKAPVVIFQSPPSQTAVTPVAPAQLRAQALPAGAEPDVAKLRGDLDAAQRAILAQLSELEASQSDIESVQRRVEALRAELLELEAKRAAIGPIPPAPSAPPESDHLELLVNQRQQEVNRLQADLDRTKLAALQKGKESRPLELAIKPVDKLPVLVELLHNRITPVTKDYFHYPFLALKPVFDIRRIKMGETIAQAQRPDSEFARFLSQIRPKQAYLSCLLNGDSFDAFYAVRAMAMRAGVDIGWEPADTTNGKIRIVGVTLGSASSKKVVRVPDIVR